MYPSTRRTTNVRITFHKSQVKTNYVRNESRKKNKNEKSIRTKHANIINSIAATTVHRDSYFKYFFFCFLLLRNWLNKILMTAMEKSTAARRHARGKKISFVYGFRVPRWIYTWKVYVYARKRDRNGREKTYRKSHGERCENAFVGKQ